MHDFNKPLLLRSAVTGQHNIVISITQKTKALHGIVANVIVTM